MSKTVTVTTRENFYADGKHRYVGKIRTWEFPDDHVLKYDANQNTLIVKSKSGEDVAVIRSLLSYVTPAVTMVEEQELEGIA
jgi:hypothetical protein